MTLGAWISNKCTYRGFTIIRVPQGLAFRDYRQRYTYYIEGQPGRFDSQSAVRDECIYLAKKRGGYVPYVRPNGRREGNQPASAEAGEAAAHGSA